MELQQQLTAIFCRLDTLERAPPPAVNRTDLKGTADAILSNLGQRLDPLESRLEGVESTLHDTDRRVKALTFAVEEGIERVSRAERRIHATVKRARKELAKLGYEDPGLESEAQELHGVDGGGGADGGVPLVPEGVEQVDDPPSSVKGVPASILRRVRGF